MNPLLQRQLKRLGLTDPSTPPSPEQWAQFLERVDSAYLGFEQDRYRTERSLDLCSKEMQGLNDELREQRDRLESEMATVARIQASIFPRFLSGPDFEGAARAAPLDRVSGDYYDIVPTEDGCWNAIGDVAGHGVATGMVVLMIQSVIGTLSSVAASSTSPATVLSSLNRVMYQNIRQRLGQDEHVTMTLLRYSQGEVTFAGAHEDILIYRAATKTCDVVPTRGMWLGAMPDISSGTHDDHLHLSRGDVMLLHTDGLWERMRDGDMLGLDRIHEPLIATGTQPISDVASQIFKLGDDWGKARDDTTVVAFRRLK